MAVMRSGPSASTSPWVKVVLPDALSPAMATMIGRSLPVAPRQARWMAICLSGISPHRTEAGGRWRPPAWGPRWGMCRGPEGWENLTVEQTVETPTPDRPTPGPAAARPVRLLLVDDHQVVLEGLVSML